MLEIYTTLTKVSNLTVDRCELMHYYLRMAIDLKHRAMSITKHYISVTKNVTPDDALNFRDRALILLEHGTILPGDSLDQSIEHVIDSFYEDY